MEINATLVEENKPSGRRDVIRMIAAGLVAPIAGTSFGQTQMEGKYVVGSGASQAALTAIDGTIAIYAGSATPSSAPFRVSYDGTFVASSATITGSVTATTGTIGGFTIAATTLTAGTTNIILDSSAKAISVNNATFGTSGIQLQYNAGSPQFYVGDGANQYFKYTGGLLSTNGNWMGANGTNFFNVPIITGTTWTNNSPIAGSIAWNSFTLAYNGVSYTIASGNTANKFIWWNKATSTTVLQTGASAPANAADQFLIALNSSGTALPTLFTNVIYSDYISVTNLAAINVNTGGLTVSSTLTMNAAASAIAIGTTPPTSATAGTGIWIDRTGLYGLNANTQQAYVNSTGQVLAGAGNVTLDANGISILTPSSESALNALTFSNGGSGLFQYVDGSNQYLYITAKAISLRDTLAYVRAVSTNTQATARLQATLNTSNAQFSVIRTSGNAYGQMEGSLIINAVGVPTATLDVRGTALFKNASNSTTAYQFQNAAGTTILNVDTTNGNTGMGTMGPLNTIHVAKALTGTRITTTPVARFSNTTVNGHTKVILGTDSATADAWSSFTAGATAATQILGFGVGNAGSNDVQLILDGNGNVGLGKSPAHLLDCNVDDCYKPTTNTWGILSDKRIKNVKRDFTDGLAVARKINPVWYRYNGKHGFKDDGEHVGVVAQDVRRVALYMIEKEKSTGLLGYQGHALPFILLNSIKELDDRLSRLESR